MTTTAAETEASPDLTDAGPPAETSREVALTSRTAPGMPALPGPDDAKAAAKARRYLGKAITLRTTLDEDDRNELVAILGGEDAISSMDIVTGEGEHEGKPFPSLDPNSEALEALAIYMAEEGDGGLKLGDLDRVKVPSGGGRTWEVPDMDAEEGYTSAQRIEGIPLASERRRSMWLSEEVTGERPDCSSMNGERPDPGGAMTADGPGVRHPRTNRLFTNPEGTCKSCPLSQFGSSFRDGSRGQQCTESRVLYILFPGDVMPTMLRVPPTSHATVKSFFMKVASKYMSPPFGIVAGFSLKVQQGGPGGKQSFAVITPNVVRQLDAPEAVLAGMRAIDWQTQLRSVNADALLRAEMMETADPDAGPGGGSGDIGDEYGDPVDEPADERRSS